MSQIWVFLALAFSILIAIFAVQNNTSVEVRFLKGLSLQSLGSPLVEEPDLQGIRFARPGSFRTREARGVGSWRTPSSCPTACPSFRRVRRVKRSKP